MDELIGRIDNILFAAGDAVDIAELAVFFEMEKSELMRVIEDEIAKREVGTGLVLKKFEGKVQLCTRREYTEDLAKFLGETNERELTRAVLETLSIIAYKQPITRGEVEEMRGVNSTYCVHSLIENGFIEEAGKKDVPGKPMMYKTTVDFLRHFGISTLEELPAVEEFAKIVDDSSEI